MTWIGKLRLAEAILVAGAWGCFEVFFFSLFCWEKIKIKGAFGKEDSIMKMNCHEKYRNGRDT